MNNHNETILKEKIAMSPNLMSEYSKGDFIQWPKD